MRGSRRAGGFTLFELTIVIAIILMLAMVAIPAMGSFFKVSKVQEATETVYRAIRTCQLNSVRNRCVTGLYFDFPDTGLMEIWTIRGRWGNANGTYSPAEAVIDGTFYSVSGDACPGWYRIHRVLNRPFRVPEGILVFGAWYSEGSGDVSWTNGWADNPLGRLKAHWVGYDPTARLAHYYKEDAYCYGYTFLLDEGSGEHAIIKHGFSRWMKPRVHYDWKIQTIEGEAVTPPEIGLKVRAKIVPFVPGVQWNG